MTGIDWSELSLPGTEFPDKLPILPLRGVVVYPHTAVPLTVGQPRSIRLIEDVQAGNQYVGLVASKNPALENPEPEDLYTTGTIATVHRLFRAPDGTIRLLVQGISRIRIDEFVETKPYIEATYTRAPETVEQGIEIEALARNAQEQFQYIAELISSIPQEIVTSIMELEDPLATIYSSPISSASSWIRPNSCWRSIRRQKSSANWSRCSSTKPKCSKSARRFRIRPAQKSTKSSANTFCASS